MPLMEKLPIDDPVNPTWRAMKRGLKLRCGTFTRPSGSPASFVVSNFTPIAEYESTKVCVVSPSRIRSATEALRAMACRGKSKTALMPLLSSSGGRYS